MAETKTPRRRVPFGYQLQEIPGLYAVATADGLDANALAEAVKPFAVAGFQPIGGVAIGPPPSFAFFQVMWKPPYEIQVPYDIDPVTKEKIPFVRDADPLQSHAK